MSKSLLSLSEIKACLRERGVTQAELARRADVTPQCVCAVLRGDRVARVEAVIARELGKPVEAVFPPARRPGRQKTIAPAIV